MKFLSFILFFVIINSTYAGDFWERVNLPNDSRVVDLTYSKNGNLFSCYTTISKSTDMGNSWNYSDYVSIQDININLYKAPKFLSAIYTASNGYIFSSMMDGIVLRSIDEGATWNMVDPELQNIQDIIETSNGRLFASNNMNLYYSDNFGDSWTRIDDFGDEHLSGFLKTKMAVSPDGKLFVSSEGVYVIDPNTLEMNHYTEGLLEIDIQCFAFANGKVFAGTTKNKILYSEDNGVSWIPIESLPSNNPISTLYVNSNGIIFAGSEYGGLFISTDNGVTWEQSAEQFGKYAINEIRKLNHKLYLCSYGIFVSEDDGETWEPLPSQPGFSIAYNFHIGNSGKKVFMSDALLYNSTDGGNSWNKVLIDNFEIRLISGIFITNDDRVFVWSSYSKLFKYTTDFGITWNDVTSIFNQGSNFKIAKDSKDNFYAIYTDSKLKFCVSKDMGANWEIIEQENYVNRLFITSNDNIILVGTDKLYLSKDGGLNWNTIDCDILNDINGNIEYIEMKDDYIWLASSKEGIIMTSDGGETWTISNEGIVPEFQWESGSKISDIDIIGDGLYASTIYGLFASDDFGKNWSYSDEGMLRSFVLSLTLQPDKHLYVTTLTGVYRSIDEITSISDEPVAIGNLLLKVSPNPLNISGNISVVSNETTNLKLSIFNSAGKFINYVYNGLVSQGETTLSIQTSELPSGQYFLRAETISESKSIIINVVK